MSEGKLLTGQELSKFTVLVRKRQQDKLTATQLANLDSTSYSDYIRQIKQQARIKTTSLHHPTSSSKEVLPKHIKGALLPKKAEHPLQIKQSPSYYYSDKLQIMSMKEFIIILEESKRKKQLEERASTREEQKRLVRDVGRSIQSSHSQRNLRLTLSSASRIDKRIKQNQYEHLF